MNNENAIRIGFKPSDLTGIGLEYLVTSDEQTVIAKLWNGNFQHDAPPVGNNEPTIAS